MESLEKENAKLLFEGLSRLTEEDVQILAQKYYTDNFSAFDPKRGVSKHPSNAATVKLLSPIS
ncbi:MAG TPA: hypothetical protein GX525_10825 [Bacilli bacterium]|nr:hypothetical protein [Bacilli bacterium]